LIFEPSILTVVAMPDTFWTKILYELPAVAAVIAVVYLFIKHIETQSRSNQEFFRELHAEHITARQESQRIIQENTEAVKDGIQATTRSTSAVQDLIRIVDRLDKR